MGVGCLCQEDVVERNILQEEQKKNQSKENNNNTFMICNKAVNIYDKNKSSNQNNTLVIIDKNKQNKQDNLKKQNEIIEKKMNQNDLKNISEEENQNQNENSSSQELGPIITILMRNAKKKKVKTH